MRMKSVVLWVWIGAYFFSVIQIQQRIVGTQMRLLLIAVVWVAGFIKLASGGSTGAARRIGATLLLLAVISCTYENFVGQPTWGTVGRYTIYALLFTLTYTAAAIVAAVFWDRERFVDVFWTIAIASGVIAIAAFAVEAAVGGGRLVSVDYYGHYRLQGFLGEPSAWAPVATAMFIMARQRRSRWVQVLAVVLVLLSRSPTVYLVFAVGVPLFYVLSSSWKAKRIPLVLFAVGIAFVGANYLGNVNTDAYLASNNTLVQSIGKLSSGIQAIRTGGDFGKNDRYKSTADTFHELDALGRREIGYGPDAHTVYFGTKFPRRGALYGLSPNSIWAVGAFDFGIYGAGLLIFLMLLAIWRMRHDTVAAAVLLPFVLSAFINSAEGPVLYQFVVLSILLYAFGWARPKPAPERSTAPPTAGALAR